MIEVSVKLGSAPAKHKQGQRVSVTEGILYVYDEDNKLVAVYAAGQWVSAEKS